MPDSSTVAPDTTGQKLKQYVDQALTQKDRIKGEQDQYNAILATAVADGFDKKVLTDLIKRLTTDEATRQAHDDLLEQYEAAYKTAQVR